MAVLKKIFSFSYDNIQLIDKKISNVKVDPRRKTDSNFVIPNRSTAS